MPVAKWGFVESKNTSGNESSTPNQKEKSKGKID